MKLIFLFIYLTLLFLPLQIFFSSRGGLAVFIGDAQSVAGSLFPVFGLLAFTLIWLQIMIGTFMRHLLRVFPGIFRFHRFEGILALTFSLLHPGLLFFSLGWDYFKFEFITPEQRLFLVLGYLAVTILLTTVTTALLYRHPLLIRNWRWVHRLNYLVLPLIFFHSKNLGGDLQSQPLSGLWWFYLITYLGALAYKLLVKKNTVTIQRPNEASQEVKPNAIR